MKDIRTSRAMRFLLQHCSRKTTSREQLRNAGRDYWEGGLQVSLKRWYVYTLSRVRYLQKVGRLLCLSELRELSKNFKRLRRHRKMQIIRRSFYAVRRLRRQLRGAMSLFREHAARKMKGKRFIILMRRKKLLARALVALPRHPRLERGQPQRLVERREGGAGCATAGADLTRCE